MKVVVAEAIDAIINGLTKPLTPEEAKGGTPAVAKVEETLKFSGATYNEAAEAINERFLARRWADGLSIVPPTKEAVNWMLTGTSRSPDEVIGVPVAPKGGKATIEKIAINAVMAGAKPEYLPVIIAAMEVLTDKSYNLLHLQASASNIVPLIVVNGPIATELGMNSGIGYLGHGWRANSTIGRAVRLCLINFGHTWPADNDMALIGRSASFGNWTFAENEKESPWKPYHVDLGFKPEESTVTVSSEQQYKQGPGGPVTAQTPYESLVGLAKIVETTEFPGGYTATRGHHDVLIGMDPNLAQRLAKVGFSKADVKQWIYEQARVPYSHLTEQERKTLSENVEKKILPMKFWFEGGTRNTKGIDPLMPALEGPDSIRIVVVGGIPGYTVLWKYDNNNGRGTKLIRGATLTKAGR